MPAELDETRLGPGTTSAGLADTTISPHRRRLVVLLEDGTPLPSSTVSLVGRDPRTRPGEQAGALVPAVHPTVSKTHATFRTTGDAVYVTDRASTNGTAVVDPRGSRRALRAWSEEKVEAGSEVLLGSYRVRVVAER